MKTLPLPDHLETERLQLRHIRYADVEPFTLFMRDPASTRYMNFAPDQKTQAGAAALVAATVDSYATASPLFVLAVTEKPEGTFIGTVGASALPKHQATEIFYSLLPGFRGRGYALESAQVLIHYLFTMARVTRVAAYIATENERSLHVAEQLGMHAHTYVTRNGMHAALYLLEADDYRAAHLVPEYELQARSF